VDPVIFVVMVALAIGLGIWWWLRRRTPEPVEDEWTLPPERGARAAAPLPEQVLDRDALLGRNRTLDTNAWDDSPDPDGASDGDAGPGARGAVPPDAAADEPADAADALSWDDAGDDDPEDLPKYFDRSYLVRRAQEPGDS
jgi:hypothetical protein